jgi:phage-related protein
MKPVTWMGSAKRDLVACTPDVRRVAGRELERVQRGLTRPIGNRWRASALARARSVATFPEAVYVLHVFEKKTRKTLKRDLALGQQRYQAMLQGRRTS